MIITKLEAYTKGRVKVYLNDELAFVLYKREMDSLPLLSSSAPFKEGIELSDGDVEYIYNNVLKKRARLRCMNLLLKQDRTEKQLMDKLKEGMYPQPVIEDAIGYVKSYGYVDDDRYARSYISYRIESVSKSVLIRDLLKKGVKKEVIDSALESVMEECPVDEEEQIRKLALKKCHGTLPEKSDAKGWQRLYRHLLGKGYSYEGVKRALGEFF